MIIEFKYGRLLFLWWDKDSSKRFLESICMHMYQVMNVKQSDFSKTRMKICTDIIKPFQAFSIWVGECISILFHQTKSHTHVLKKQFLSWFLPSLHVTTIKKKFKYIYFIQSTKDWPYRAISSYFFQDKRTQLWKLVDIGFASYAFRFLKKWY